MGYQDRQEMIEEIVFLRDQIKKRDKEIADLKAQVSPNAGSLYPGHHEAVPPPHPGPKPCEGCDGC